MQTVSTQRGAWAAHGVCAQNQTHLPQTGLRLETS